MFFAIVSDAPNEQGQFMSTAVHSADAAPHVELEALALALELHHDCRVIRKFVPKTHYHLGTPAGLSRGIILDTESTGTDIRVDKIIELGMILFEFCPDTGKVYRVLDTFNQLEDPGMPIPAGATAVNGIVDEMVAGKSIVDAEVASFIKDVDIIIAHKSDFDRPMVERRFPFFADAAWGCSLRQVDWNAEDIGSHKLDYITYRLGYYYEAHRAEADCAALLEALQRPLPVSDGLALKQILERSAQQSHRIRALGAPFDKKDELKKRGYSWGDGTDGNEKAWYLEVPASDYDAEIAWLKQNVHSGKGFRVAVETVDALNRFSIRNGDRQSKMY